MIIDNYLDKEISRQVIKENQEKRDGHVSSGKLSASMLGQPLQWQILKSFGVPAKEIDEYTLRKFKRGNDVEDWYLGCIPKVLEKQKFVEYRGVVGFIDSVVDTADWEFPSGILPLEVKSTSNAKFKRIVMSGQPDKGHCLQNALYAIAEGMEKMAISYVATDDYRVHTFIVNVSDWATKVEEIITRYDEQKKIGKVPVFIAEENWQKDIKYNNYPEWSNLTQEEIDLKLTTYLSTK